MRGQGSALVDGHHRTKRTGGLGDGVGHLVAIRAQAGDAERDRPVCIGHDHHAAIGAAERHRLDAGCASRRVQADRAGPDVAEVLPEWPRCRSISKGSSRGIRKEILPPAVRTSNGPASEKRAQAETFAWVRSS